MGRLHKSIQLMLEFQKVRILVLHLPYYKLMTFLIMLSVILLSMLIILLQTSDLWKQLELAVELESDLGPEVGCWFQCCQNSICSVWQSNDTGAIDVKIDEPVLEENHLLRCWSCLSLLIWSGALILFLLLKLPPRKLEIALFL